MTGIGTHTKLDDGRHQVRFERHLNHPIERVWPAITEPDQIEAWLAAAEIEPRAGGAVRLEWLNTGDQEVVARARSPRSTRRGGSSSSPIFRGR